MNIFLFNKYCTLNSGVKLVLPFLCSSFQFPRFRMADLASQLVASRLMVRNAAQRLDERAPGHAELCAMAKLYATETCSQVS